MLYYLKYIKMCVRVDQDLKDMRKQNIVFIKVMIPRMVVCRTILNVDAIV